MAAIAVFQDQENVIQEQGTLSKGQTRVAPKPFLSENVHQATPRKALGDVRNIQIPKQSNSVKAIMQSDKKVPSSVARHPKSSFRKPLGTGKKSGKHTITILEDEATEKVGVKEKTKTKQSEACSLQDRTQKEHCFPFTDTDFQFSMPNYLRGLSDSYISDHIWLPSYTWCRPKQDISEFDPEISKINMETLPAHSDLMEPYFDDVKTDILEVPIEPSSYPGSFCELSDIESDLADIDAACSLSTEYSHIIRKLDAIELCTNGDNSENDKQLNASKMKIYMNEKNDQ